MLVQDLDKPMLAGTESFNDRKKSVVDYFIRTFRSHNSYVFKFVFCEVLNLVNVLFQVSIELNDRLCAVVSYCAFQMYLMDLFLNRQFTKYGTQILSQSEEEIESRRDPMNRIFPKVVTVNMWA
jgi:hypothetical protein